MRRAAIYPVRTIAAGMVYGLCCFLAGGMTSAGGFVIERGTKCRPDFGWYGLFLLSGIITLAICVGGLLAVAVLASIYAGSARKILAFSAAWGCISGSASMLTCGLLGGEPWLQAGVAVGVVSVGACVVFYLVAQPRRHPGHEESELNEDGAGRDKE